MKLGIIGCGQMGDNYARKLRESLNVSAADLWAHDIDRAKTLGLCEKFGIGMSEGLPTNVDAAIVAVNTPAHADVIVKLVKAGIRHILCEKPLGLNSNDVGLIKRWAGRAQVYTGLVINTSPALQFLQNLMGDKGLVVQELYGDWGKPRPLDKNARPSAGDVEDESIHPIAFALALIQTQRAVRRVGVSADVGTLSFVDPAVQEAACDQDASFPRMPNHRTSARLQVVTNYETVPVDVRSSFLLAKQTRVVGGILGSTPDSVHAVPRCLFEVSFDQQADGGGEDVLTLVDLKTRQTEVEHFKTDKLGDLTRAFVNSITSEVVTHPGLAGIEHAALLVRISDAILKSDHKKGGKIWVA